jgi:hypothetical protein
VGVGGDQMWGTDRDGRSGRTEKDRGRRGLNPFAMVGRVSLTCGRPREEPVGLADASVALTSVSPMEGRHVGSGGVWVAGWSRGHSMC